MRVLSVVSHPRKDSLIFKVAERFVQILAEAGHDYEILDLHGIGFDPILKGVDEPDGSATEQSISPKVEMEIRRMKEHVLWIGLAGASEEQLKKRNYDEMITH
ncbi:MAG TPA: NAD(P)H-dependent oxidoreductase, partial [Candidatus Paenibacillus intestinavium]|nr:NAD(P)H-dependent oxidoreductase [Candidatus Paenibacillus intestinavium]